MLILFRSPVNTPVSVSEHHWHEVGPGDFPTHKMPSKAWPQYPVVNFGGVYFVMTECPRKDRPVPMPKFSVPFDTGYLFQQLPVYVPTRAQALKTAADLHASREWKSLHWKVSVGNYSCDYNEEKTWQFIQQQAERVR